MQQYHRSATQMPRIIRLVNGRRQLNIDRDIFIPIVADAIIVLDGVGALRLLCQTITVTIPVLSRLHSRSGSRLTTTVSRLRMLPASMCQPTLKPILCLGIYGVESPCLLLHTFVLVGLWTKHIHSTIYLRRSLTSLHLTDKGFVHLASQFIPFL